MFSLPLPMRARRAAALLLLLCVTSCGSGGGTVFPTLPLTISLGTLSSTAPTTVTPSFASPLGGPATVTVVSESGPFAITPGAVPASVDASGSVALPVAFAPSVPGPVQGSILLSYEREGTTRTQEYILDAHVEAVTWSASPFPVGFGVVTPNTTVDKDITLRNTSAVSVLALSTATLPGPRFSLLASPFPLTLQPGNAVTFTLRYEPVDMADDSGLLVLGAGDPGGPIDIPVLAGVDGPGSEEIADFGEQTFLGNGMTDQLTVTLPPDAISLTLEGTATEDDVLGLGELIGPNGRVYENTQLTGDYIWVPIEHAFATTVPNTDQAALQLEGPGDYVFRIVRMSGPSATVRVRAIVERRSPGFESVATLPLNVWLADGLPVDAASAPTDTDLQATLNRMDAILSGQGIRLGDIAYYDVTDGDFDRIQNDQEFGELLKLSSGAAEERLNLFFVQFALRGSVVGVSATINGPKARGTIVSGVMSIYSSNSAFIGLVAAHEVAHFCGLFHTVEQNGEHDFIDDTANCPPSGTNGSCPTPGGNYLMHWSALGGTNLSAGQGHVLRAHPLMEPTPADFSKFRPRVQVGAPLTLEALQRLGTNWCGTCRRPVSTKGAR